MICQLIDTTQLLFTTIDPETGDTFVQNSLIDSAINMFRVQSNSRFTVHTNWKTLKSTKAKSKVQNGLVFVDGPLLESLSTEVLEVMQSSQAILTHDVQVKELFARVVQKATEDKSPWQWCLNCVIFVVSKEDFDFI